MFRFWSGSQHSESVITRRCRQHFVSESFVSSSAGSLWSGRLMNWRARGPRQSELMSKLRKWKRYVNCSDSEASVRTGRGCWYASSSDGAGSATAESLRAWRACRRHGRTSVKMSCPASRSRSASGSTVPSAPPPARPGSTSYRRVIIRCEKQATPPLAIIVRIGVPLARLTPALSQRESEPVPFRRATNAAGNPRSLDRRFSSAVGSVRRAVILWNCWTRYLSSIRPRIRSNPSRSRGPT
jgi:hypothetical protein